jgi:hypothetical protein
MAVTVTVKSVPQKLVEAVNPAILKSDDSNNNNSEVKKCAKSLASVCAGVEVLLVQRDVFIGDLHSTTIIWTRCNLRDQTPQNSREAVRSSFNDFLTTQRTSTH